MGQNLKDLKQFEINKLDTPIPKMPRLKSDAEWTHERLKKYIEDFEKELDDEHQVGIKLVSFGNGNSFYVEDIGYWGPDLICFYCYDKNTESEVQLIQNVSQINLLLMALPIIKEVRKKVGFRVNNNEENY